MTISTGFAVYPNDGDNTEQLFHAADMAMYQAKMLKKRASNSADILNSLGAVSK